MASGCNPGALTDSNPSEVEMNPTSTLVTPAVIPIPNDSGSEDLAASFASSFNVTNYPNDTNKPHPRFSQYKMKSSSLSQVSWLDYPASMSYFSIQDVRRKKLLEHQKARRDDFLNFSRGLSNGDLEEEMEEDEEDTSVEVGEEYNYLN